MNLSTFEHHIAWGVYLLAGLVFLVVWWRVTRGIGRGGWRSLLRGMAAVTIFTPWYVSDAHEHLAPAAVVLLMDLLVGGSGNGLAALMALLVTTSALLAILLVMRRARVKQANAPSARIY